MKSGLTAKKIFLFFALLVGLYVAAFYGVEHLNRRKGPWLVTFMSDQTGKPAIVIYQPKLSISSVEILFPDEKVTQTNLVEKVQFERPRQPVPFGKVIYEDLLALPGVVTFDLFGHEIELLPRVLVVNKKQVPWKSEAVIELTAADKPADPPKPPPNLPR